MRKIQLSFARFTDAGLLTKANLIALSMTNNAAFSDSVPTLVTLQAAIENYSTSLTAAGGLGRNNVAEKNQKRAILEQLLIQLGMYVMFIANGDVATLISSGYTLTKEPQPRYLANPGNVTLGNGITSGEMTSSVATGNAKSFLHQISEVLPTEDSAWTTFPSSASQYVFKNLTPGKQYWVRVAAIGNRNQLAYSNVATQFVQ